MTNCILRILWLLVRMNNLITMNLNHATTSFISKEKRLLLLVDKSFVQFSVLKTCITLKLPAISIANQFFLMLLSQLAEIVLCEENFTKVDFKIQ